MTENKKAGSAICGICPRRCHLHPGQYGFCRARKNENGLITCDNYGRIVSLALDPIEKKPLKHFRPGSMILSAGSYGCNLLCPFCQNHRLSMASREDIPWEYISPDKITETAQNLKARGNIGVAFTYNEPLISYEYVYDCSRSLKKKSMSPVLVTNGYICEDPLKKLLPFIDAMNIDLKGFTKDFYNRIGGDLETVKSSIMLASEFCHIEISTLVIPGMNDSHDEMEKLSSWLASIDKDIPLHVSRFFPRYKMSQKDPTPVKSIYELADTARKHLKYVHTGNC